MFQRPRSLTDDEKAAALNPPRTKCCVPAPPVLEFDTDGNLLRSWGGPGEGYQWFGNEHGIEVSGGFVWLTGNANDDSQILKFTPDGKFVLQIGKIAPAKGSNDTTQLGRPAEVTVDKDANEVYIADGYGNRRVIVFDATTGAYKRHWGAYGKPPNDDKQPPYDPKAPVAQQFGNPVHCVKIANDGLVYVCDRTNNRIQVFKKDGTFVKEWFYEKNTLGQRRGLGRRDLARSEADLAVERRRRQQRNPGAETRGRHRGRPFRQQRPQRRAIPLGPHHGDRRQRQPLYRRGRYRKAYPEVQTDVRRATIGGLPGTPGPTRQPALNAGMASTRKPPGYP